MKNSEDPDQLASLEASWLGSRLFSIEGIEFWNQTIIMYTVHLLGLIQVVVECLTRDRGAGGSCLTGVTAMCPWARHINPSLVLVQSKKTRPYITERLLMGRKESNQTTNVTTGKYGTYTYLLAQANMLLTMFRNCMILSSRCKSSSPLNR